MGETTASVVKESLTTAAFVIALMLAAPASAAPPPVDHEDYAVMAPFHDWVRTLQANGRFCCDWSDTRPVQVRTLGERYQVRFRRDQVFGAPVGIWLDVPDDAVIRTANPIGVAIASYYGGRVQCFVDAGGI